MLRPTKRPCEILSHLGWAWLPRAWIPVTLSKFISPLACVAQVLAAKSAPPSTENLIPKICVNPVLMRSDRFSGWTNPISRCSPAFGVCVLAPPDIPTASRYNNNDESSFPGGAGDCPTCYLSRLAVELWVLSIRSSGPLLLHKEAAGALGMRQG